MEFIATGIEGLWEIKPRIFEDGRGHFFEAYHEGRLQAAGIPTNFVQDNQSYSHKGVLRGLHLQLSPKAQAKLVRVITGKALDVAVDLRPNSPTFGQHYKCILDGNTQNMLMVPEGFAHGFLALEETIFFYKCSNLYHKDSEVGLLWNDPDLGIDWEIDTPILSDKDKELLSLKEFKERYGDQV